jgi:hypothetical protein
MPGLLSLQGKVRPDIAAATGNDAHSASGRATRSITVLLLHTLGTIARVPFVARLGPVVAPQTPFNDFPCDC